VTARARCLVLLASLALVFVPATSRAGFVIVNTDGPGEGFNDPTPAAPVGGNPGTTVGQQRLNVFVKAGQIWDAILQSPVTIRVQASFDPLSCTPTSGVLGGAGPNAVDSDFPGAGFAGTWYTGAEANRLSGVDQDPTFDDIGAQFQSNVGTAGCLTTRSWYYGFDGNEGANGLDLLAVLLHELGHGIGFLTLTDETDGSYFSSQPTIWDRYLMDNVSHKHWIDMTPAERVASAINTGHLVWDGPAVNAAAPHFLGKRARVLTTGAITGDFTSGQGVFSPTLTTGGVTAQVVLVNDGVGTVTDGCNTPFTNAGAVAGKIALMDRSATCAAANQAANAQANGAIGVILINNVAGPEPPLRGSSPTVTIPVTALSQTDGTAIKVALGSGTVTATLSLDATKLAGTDNLSPNRMRLYDPNPDQPGSSVSHYDVSAFPNLLMEPAINPDLTTNVDMTFHNLDDIGWFPQLVSVPGMGTAGLSFVYGPNPATDGGTLRFRLAQSQRVELSLYDLAGRRVARIADGVLDAGDHTYRWSRTDDAGHKVAAGIYRAQLKAGTQEQSLSVVLID
jgi:flagellar hook assembly protein FlgD